MQPQKPLHPHFVFGKGRLCGKKGKNAQRGFVEYGEVDAWSRKRNVTRYSRGFSESDPP